MKTTRIVSLFIAITFALSLGIGCKSSTDEGQQQQQPKVETKKPAGERCEHNEECQPGLLCIRLLCIKPPSKPKKMKREVETINENRQKRLDHRIKQQY